MTLLGTMLSITESGSIEVLDLPSIIFDSDFQREVKDRTGIDILTATEEDVAAIDEKELNQEKK